MSTHLTLKCDGCDAQTQVGPIRKSFRSFSGRSHGFGTWSAPDIDAAVEPTGWQWSDPLTSCCYCPKCWTEIESGKAA